MWRSIVAVDELREGLVRQLLKERSRQQGACKLSLREIARRAGVARGTVQRILEVLEGRVVQKLKDDEEREDETKLPFTPVADYVCPDCSAAAGRTVWSGTVPCLACQARAARALRTLMPWKGRWKKCRG